MENNTETFNEKCDRVLRYLIKRPSQFTEITSWQQFKIDTGIDSGDPVISFLQKEKKFIGYTKHDIYIESLGISFIENNSFHKSQLNAEMQSSLLWYNHQDAKQRFEDYPTVKRQRNVAYIVSIISLLVTITAVIVAIYK